MAEATTAPSAEDPARASAGTASGDWSWGASSALPSPPSADGPPETSAAGSALDSCPPAGGGVSGASVGTCRP
eukprot:4313435-Lingulodinium_polyedra.AAC.1